MEYPGEFCSKTSRPPTIACVERAGHSATEDHVISAMGGSAPRAWLASASGSLATWQALVCAAGGSPKIQAADDLERDAVTFTVELSAEETACLLQDVPSAYRTQINDARLTALARLDRAPRLFVLDRDGGSRPGGHRQ